MDTHSRLSDRGYVTQGLPATQGTWRQHHLFPRTLRPSPSQTSTIFTAAHSSKSALNLFGSSNVCTTGNQSLPTNGLRLSSPSGMPLNAILHHLPASLATTKTNLVSSKPTGQAPVAMGWILMQPDDSTASVSALALLRAEGICLFDITMKGASLRPVRFGSRGCTEMESHLHSFVGEAGCGRWGISQNRKYLWGSEFFWMCDCSAVCEILEYEGPIHQIRRWAQELLGYHFQVFHRPARMRRGRSLPVAWRSFSGSRSRRTSGKLGHCISNWFSNTDRRQQGQRDQRRRSRKEEMRQGTCPKCPEDRR
jgi:hypothetical protein